MVSIDSEFCERCGLQMEKSKSIPIKQAFSEAWEKIVGAATVIVVGLLCLAIVACGIYVLVAFVKWCWEHS